LTMHGFDISLTSVGRRISPPDFEYSRKSMKAGVERNDGIQLTSLAKGIQ